MTLKFVVLSDLHLVAPGATSKGIDTAGRLRDGVTAVNTRHSDAAFCVLAGDLADRGEIAAYKMLREILDGLTIPCHITIGNHDKRQRFLEAFPGLAAETGYIDKVIDADGQRVILLDSAITDAPQGRLEAMQLDWLKRRLKEVWDKPVIVVLHHHANRLGTLVDRIRLENGADLAAVLSQHGGVRQVIAGHVHYTSTALWHGIPFTTIAGGHYGVTLGLGDLETDVQRITGPAQMGVVVSDATQTLVHFDNYVDDHTRLVKP